MINWTFFAAAGAIAAWYKTAAETRFSAAHTVIRIATTNDINFVSPSKVFFCGGSDRPIVKLYVWILALVRLT